MSRRVLAVALLGAALSVSACSPVEDVLGVQRNTAVLSIRPVLTTAQASGIAARALGQAQRADALQTEKAASTAYTGTALRLAAPTYVVEKVLDPGRDRSVAALQTGVPPSRVIVTAGRSFPRSLLAVATPDGSATAQLSVMESKDVRSPYRVSARADLLPGAVLPPTVPNDRGAAMLRPDVGGLVATPAKALADYAKLLQTGKSGGTEFAADIVVKSVRDNAAGQARGVRKVAVFAQTHRPEADGVHVLRTADGGAIVVAAIDRVDEFRVKKNAGSIKAPTAYTALSRGIAKITKRAEVTTVQMVVMVLPPQGRGRARVVGFTELPFSVKAT